MHRLRLLLLAVTLAGSLSAQTTYLSNTANAVNNGIYVYDTQWLARSFTTGTNAAGYELNSVDLGFNSGSGADATFTASLWTNSSGGMPGTSVATFTTPATGAHFDLAGGYGLAANTAYWLVVSSTASTSNPSNLRIWSTTNDPSVVSLDSWAFGSIAVSSNSGSSWFGSGQSYLFGVNATAMSAVPEPSTYAALLGACALGLVAWRRRQARV